MNGEELRCVQAFLGMSLRGAQRRSNPYPWLSLWESWHGEAVTERASSATHFPSAGRGLPALRILSMVLRRAASGPGQPLLPSAIHLHSGRRAGSAVDEPSSMVCLLPQTGTHHQSCHCEASKKPWQSQGTDYSHQSALYATDFPEIATGLRPSQ